MFKSLVGIVSDVVTVAVAPLQARKIREAVDSIRQVYTLPLIRSIER